MRVTEQMADRRMLHNLHNTMSRLLKASEQMSSGRRINKPSDDVPDTAIALRLQRQIGTLETYNVNLRVVDDMLKNSASILQLMSESLSRIRELGVQGATGSYTGSDRKAIAMEVDKHIESLLGLANAKQKDAYIFAGQSQEIAPYKAVRNEDGVVIEVKYQGGASNTMVPVAPEREAEVNLVGREVLDAGGDLFRSLIELRDALRASDMEAIPAKNENLKDVQDHVRISLAILGARQSELQTLQRSLDRLVEVNTDLISDRVDADLAGVSIEYNKTLVLMQQVLRVATMAMQPSLADML